VLEIRFPKEYPHSPPFIRVIRPRFLPFIQGGGGHVTGGGAMCMELLTNSGWSSVSSIDGVLLQVRMAIMNLEPKPARLESQAKTHQRDYGTAEAMEAYIRACRTHGWEVPKDFQDFASGGGAAGGRAYY
jgi:ubiquitin-conjugating enzyme E2 Q